MAAVTVADPDEALRIWGEWEAAGGEGGPIRPDDLSHASPILGRSDEEQLVQLVTTTPGFKKARAALRWRYVACNPVGIAPGFDATTEGFKEALAAHLPWPWSSVPKEETAEADLRYEPKGPTSASYGQTIRDAERRTEAAKEVEDERQKLDKVARRAHWRCR